MPAVKQPVHGNETIAIQCPDSFIYLIMAILIEVIAFHLKNVGTFGGLTPYKQYKTVHKAGIERLYLL